MASVPSSHVDRPSPKYVRYERLMSLTVRHDFYNGDLFPDFTITPTAPTQTLLRNLELIARPRRAGIDILYHTDHSGAILRYLHNHGRHRSDETPPPHDQSRAYNKSWTYDGCWSRLTFTLSTANELFTNFTELPLTKTLDEMRPPENVLYLSNRYTEPVHGKPARLIADRSSRVVSVPQVNFSPVNLDFAVPPGATEFILYDTSGRAILRASPDYPREDKPLTDKSPKNKWSEIPPRAHLTSSKAGGSVDVSMANEGPGLFSYEIYQTADKDRRLLANEEFFYAGTQAAPLLFVDLFLASPDEPANAESGRYPIVLPEQLADEPTHAAANAAAQKHITPCDYELRFKARKTIWTYYIVLPSGEVASTDLAIRAEPQGSLEFRGPHNVTLPTGVPATRFTARKAVPLRRRSDISLRLQSGGDPGNGSARILLERLPTPSAERISPPPQSTGGAATSEIFVYL